ncbi:hypothetical protein ACFYY8_29435 [Streptosporangium sp. NPDC001559]|uniref:hypothetical protein n=1 Tax=Streptosporangium sp. NPDC001559 TaxID=3366187 RepID=UPI0036E615D0
MKDDSYNRRSPYASVAASAAAIAVVSVAAGFFNASKYKASAAIATAAAATASKNDYSIQVDAETAIQEAAEYTNTAVAIAITAAIVIIITGPIIAKSYIPSFRHPLQQRGAAIALTLAVWIGGPSQRWRAEDWLAAITESSRPICYGLGLVVAAIRIRLHNLGELLMVSARWVLASNWRTWGPLGSMMIFAAVNVYRSQGWGSVFYTLPTIISFNVGVEWLRHRWGIEVKPKRSAEGSDKKQDNRT